MKACQSMKLHNSLETFLCNIQTGYPTQAKRALQILISFVTTWLCGSGFLSLLHLKNKYRNALDPQNNLRIALSHKVPRFEQIWVEKFGSKEVLPKFGDVFPTLDFLELYG